MRIERGVVAPLAWAGAVTIAGLLAWAPASIDLGFAVALAISWCIWLETHPAA